jgi:hypothetical protein
MPKQDGKTIVIVCPEFAWLQIEETLQTDMQAADFDKETRDAIAKAYETLTVIEGPNAHHLFGFRVHSATVKGWVTMCRLWGHLIVNDSLLVAVVPLPDDEYQIFVREDHAAALDEALIAIDANNLCARKEQAPDAHLEEEYEDRVSGPGE